jgi:phosphosulfolactate phosphohydrolase-like enzyme
MHVLAMDLPKNEGRHHISAGPCCALKGIGTTLSSDACPITMFTTTTRFFAVERRRVGNMPVAGNRHGQTE